MAVLRLLKIMCMLLSVLSSVGLILALSLMMSILTFLVRIVLVEILVLSFLSSGVVLSLDSVLMRRWVLLVCLWMRFSSGRCGLVESTVEAEYSGDAS